MESITENQPSLLPALGIMVSKELRANRHIRMLQLSYANSMRSSLWFSGLDTTKSADTADYYLTMKSLFEKENKTLLQEQLRQKALTRWRELSQAFIQYSVQIGLKIFSETAEKFAQRLGFPTIKDLQAKLNGFDLERFPGNFNRVSWVMQQIISQKTPIIESNTDWENEKIRWLVVFVRQYESPAAQEVLLQELRQRNSLDGGSSMHSVSRVGSAEDLQRWPATDAIFEAEQSLQQKSPQELEWPVEEPAAANIDSVVRVMAQSAAELKKQADGFIEYVESVWVCLMQILERVEDQPEACDL
jgi:hypothetical protein